MAIETIALSHAKQRLLELAREVDEGGKRFMLVRGGVPVGVLVPVEEYEGWEETLAILEDPAMMRSLRRGLADAKAGRIRPRARIRRAPTPTAARSRSRRKRLP